MQEVHPNVFAVAGAPRSFEQNSRPAPEGNQSFKYVPLDAIIPGINPYMM